MRKLLFCIALLAGWGHSFAQTNAERLEFKEHISKQIALQGSAANSVFALYNVFGSIKVEGYNGSQVIIEIDKTISAKTDADMAKAKAEFKLGFDSKADSIIAYTAAPYDNRPHQRRNNDEDHERHYTVQLDYIVKVPNNMSLRVSTINDGGLTIKDVYGQLKVNNVNGAITIVNAKNTTDAHTVNGDITVNYLALPAEACNYRTINGKIEVTYPSALAANVQFKSLNGGFYTDFDDTETLPASVVKTTDKKSNGAVYKLNKITEIRIGKGGKLFNFETLNGNIYIKKA